MGASETPSTWRIPTRALELALAWGLLLALPRPAAAWEAELRAGVLDLSDPLMRSLVGHGAAALGVSLGATVAPGVGFQVAPEIAWTGTSYDGARHQEVWESLGADGFLRLPTDPEAHFHLDLFAGAAPFVFRDATPGDHRSWLTYAYRMGATAAWRIGRGVDWTLRLTHVDATLDFQGPVGAGGTLTTLGLRWTQGP